MMLSKKSSAKMKAKFLIAYVFLVFVTNGLASAPEECSGQDDCEATSRTRREVVSPQCTDVMTPQQANSMYSKYDTYPNTDNYTRPVMDEKQQVFQNLTSVIPKVCRAKKMGESPSGVKSGTRYITVIERKSCEKTASREFGFEPVRPNTFKLSDSLFVNRSDWNCSQNGDRCDGVCIGATKMGKDLFSNFTTKCLSNRINVDMFDPATSGKPIQLSVDRNRTVVALQFQFNKGNKPYQSSSFRCALWRKDLKQWDPSSCTLEVVVKKTGNDPELARCECIRLGTVCVVRDDAFSPIVESSKGFSGASPGVSTTSSPATTSSSGANNGSENGQNQGNGSGSTTSAPVTQASEVSTAGGNAPAQGGTTGPVSGLGTTTASSNSGGGGGVGGDGGGNNGGGGNAAGGPVNNGKFYGSVTFPGDCQTIINTPKADELMQQTKQKLTQELNVENVQIQDMKVICGSVIVNFTIVQLNTSVIDHKKQALESLVINNNFVVTLADGTKLVASAARLGQSFANMTPVYARPTSPPPTTRERYELKFDYTPIMMTVAIVIFLVVLCVCCTCIVHSYWLRKNKFTEYNSMTAKEYAKKMNAKKEKERMKEVVDEVPMQVIGVSTKVAPTNFDMSNDTMPKINERSFTNYDWAHTSYLPATVTAGQPESDNADAPKLMLDDSDSDGEENEGYESDDNQQFPRTVSHLSLAKDKSAVESSDSTSNIAPPLYENAVSQDKGSDTIEPIYDNIKDD